MKRAVQLVSLLGLLTLFATGCTMPPKIDWDARVGIYTFDAAVKEMGPPDKSALLSDGLKVAEWLTIHGWSTPTYHSFPDGRVFRTDSARGPDRWLQLTFDPDGRLKSWKRVWR